MLDPTLFRVFIPIEPIPKGRPRFGVGRAFTPIKTRHYESDVKTFVSSAYKNSPLSGPLRLHVFFYMTRPKGISKNKRLFPDVKPDIDNLFKAIADALSGVLWNDDCQLVDIWATKVYAAQPLEVGTHVSVMRIGLHVEKSA